MIITCDECNSSFSLNDSMIKDTGSKVRCSKCDNVFVAYPHPVEEVDTIQTAEDDDLGLDDLEADLGDFLDEDAPEEALAAPSDAEGTELELDEVDDIMEADTKLTLDNADDAKLSELDLNLDFDQDAEMDSLLEEDSVSDDELPELDDLENLADIDDEDLAADEIDSDFAELDLELEAETDTELAAQSQDESDPTDLSLDMDSEEELDLSDLDLEADNEAELDLADNGLEAEDEAGLDLTDLTLEEKEFSASVEPHVEPSEPVDTAETDGDELDLSDLELAIEDDSTAEDVAQGPAEELNIELENEELGVEENADADLELQGSDELDLSDLDLATDDAPIAEEATSGDQTELDLDLDLDLEDETVASGETPADDELDLVDITDIVEEAEEPAVANQPEDLDLELELDEIGATAVDESAAVDPSSGIDELDLSDLEGIIEAEAAPAEDAVSGGASQDVDMDLDLQLNEPGQSTETAPTAEDGDELDFSDLEQMLESDETPSVETPESSNDQEQDLQFDLDGASAEDADQTVAAEAGSDGQEEDFLDIEQLLEEGEDNSPSTEADLAGDVTDLPLDMEAALNDASKGAETELELDFDLESELQAKEELFDGQDPAKDELESNLLDSEDMGFLEDAGIEESDFQDESETSVVATDDFESDAFTDSGDAKDATHVLPLSDTKDSAAETLDMPPPEAEEPPKRRRSKKPALVVLVLLVLGLGVFTVPNMLGIQIPYISDIKIPYLSDLNVKIPYLSDWLNPAPQDIAGNLKIIPLGNTINGRFVKNSKTGQLFVIQGQVKNDYDHPRSFIKVTGKLYQKGMKMAKKSTVYVGNTLSNSDLAAMDMAAINKKLSSRTGQKQSNLKVKTGKRVPFMIVFDKLPGNLDEYTVEVEGSSL